MKKTLLLTVLFFAASTPVFSADDYSQQQAPFVTCNFIGQMGNNLFQTAATYALAWENNAKPFIPTKAPKIQREHVFSRCAFIPKEGKQPSSEWGEPSFAFHPIRYRPNMKISGYFQSEKYFAKYRNQILELFAPLPEDKKYIEEKYQHILSHPNSVGVQLRYYHREQAPKITPQYGKDYLAKAMSQFPYDSLFVVSSDKLSYARACIPSFAKNVIFLEGEQNYIDMYVLSMCTHNIISNSSFGWWGAWLNQNPNKRVICPKTVFHNLPCQNYYPSEWTPITASYD